jgi:hypothetical protein
VYFSTNIENGYEDFLNNKIIINAINVKDYAQLFLPSVSPAINTIFIGLSRFLMDHYSELFDTVSLKMLILFISAVSD